MVERTIGHESFVAGFNFNCGVGNREKKAGDNAGRGTGGLVDNAAIANFGLADAGIVAGDSGIDIFD